MDRDDFVHQLPDPDPEETAEWVESREAVVAGRGPGRARYLLHRLLDRANDLAVGLGPMRVTPYVNTIPVDDELPFPGDPGLERRIRCAVRWNAVAMVDRANLLHEGIGGHLSTYSSAAALYEVGFNHFFRGPEAPGGGDQVYFQGHSAPGIYARAFVEGRFDEARLDAFRRQLSGTGLPSYPHPRRMPEFWQFPTVSMGLGPLNAVAQARCNRYLAHRGILDTSAAHVWCFVGDGEMDEPESLAGLAIAARERLDNLTFVVNCNLQRLDGPVRGNAKIIQEHEAIFGGAGWNVIKVIWGAGWDPLLAADVDGLLVDRMNEIVDGEFQKYSVESGAYIREHFFGSDPRLAALVEHLDDDALQRLPRGGHDDVKVYNAFAAAIAHRGQPTVILAKTVKGWALGRDIEARNATHQIKRMSTPELHSFRDRMRLPIPDADLADGVPPFFRFPAGSEEFEYLQARRRALGGPLPSRRSAAPARPAPAPAVFDEFAAGSGGRPGASTTTAFTRLLRSLLADPTIGDRVVPIIPDEARTFGMDALFREYRIYAPGGQRYEPVDASLLLAYREATDGQVLEEGINEAGALAMFTAAGTAYSTWGEPLIPFFTFYSMFGFQRVGDLIWAFGDQLGRGFLLGATAGRTTLAGEGLQHNDGHSHVLASVVPNLRAYDPAFAFETAVIVRDGIERMYGPAPEDCFYYLTLYNENIVMPAAPTGVDDGIVHGLYPFAAPPAGERADVSIVASGSAMGAALEARDLLAERFGVEAEVWSATSWKALRDDALDVARWNRLHPDRPAREPYVTECLGASDAPVVAVSDFMVSVADQIARWVRRPFVALGTDGYGFSDTRAALRRHFEVDAAHICVAALAELAATGRMDPTVVRGAIDGFGIDPEAPPPRSA
ncbi:MAG: pyruvate dehydrogenase (acetyl-transferring), homodimeric type [Actinomycetota bacterium]